MSVPSRSADEINANWRQILYGIKLSADEFYGEIESRIKAKELPKCLFGRVSFKQGRVFRGSRLYLRVMHDEHVFDICAFPFGVDATCVSWWQGSLSKIGCLGVALRMIPVVGDITRLRDRVTYYSLDVAVAFQSALNDIVLGILDEIMDEQKIPKIKDEDRKPVMRGFFD